MTEQAHPEWDASYTAGHASPCWTSAGRSRLARLAEPGPPERASSRRRPAAPARTRCSQPVTAPRSPASTLRRPRSRGRERRRPSARLAARFEVADALDLARLSLTVDTVIDSGVFHVFGDVDRARYVTSLAAVLRPGGGAYYLMCFSDRQPGTWRAASARTSCARRSATAGPSSRLPPTPSRSTRWRAPRGSKPGWPRSGATSQPAPASPVPPACRTR